MYCYYCGDRITIEPIYDFDLEEDEDDEDLQEIKSVSIGMQCACECGFSGPICDNADDAAEAHRVMFDLLQKHAKLTEVDDE
jgi:hypothetical protein